MHSRQDVIEMFCKPQAYQQREKMHLDELVPTGLFLIQLKLASNQLRRFDSNGVRCKSATGRLGRLRRPECLVGLFSGLSSSWSAGIDEAHSMP